MAGKISLLIQKIKIIVARAAGVDAKAAATLANPPGAAAEKPGQRYQPATSAPKSLWKRLLVLAPRKRHRKEINQFPPAKAYSHGRHEIKTRHEKGAAGARKGRTRGGHNK